MKRFFILCSVLLILCSPFLLYRKETDFFNKFAGKYSFVTDALTAPINAIMDVVKSGNEFIVCCDKAEREYAILRCGKIKSEMLEIDLSNCSFDEIVRFLNFQFVEDSVIENRRIITGFSQGVRYVSKIGTKKINTQIAIFENNIVVGFPLIRASF